MNTKKQYGNGIPKKDYKDDILKPEDITVPFRRCPECSELSLEFDSKTGRFKCKKCGHELYEKRAKL